ncbi:NAD-dependent epimerase/dehydratase family protein [Porphyromonas gingivalis]|uniref:NAD-dependent epimerase/dehydratase family protein n=1 Tax=Porphyromonas gingivalis TaxID=837 RepID=A0AAF0BCQ2_PORGN|nr:NAD-dependent epimerase/dehydratase family protein [Porphyromonas gingivalis]AIJ35235.1 hypothetical protein EG14_03945 [Porphyromonas gingivalis]WCF98147.1 NAD-dependent epimerase/dehydratase family protein [Porphyromonas gingivalis]
MTNKNILIIGGYGFIGSALVEKYYKENNITIIDNSDYSTSSLGLRNIDISKINIHHGDATDKDFILSIGDNFDYIVNAAAILGIKKVAEKSIQTIQTNISTSNNSLELAKKQKHLLKYLSFSTSEVYGIKTYNSKECDEAVIGPPNEARWCYAASKILIDHLAFAYHREYNIPITIIRPFNIFGEYRLGSNAINTFVSKMLSNEPVYIDGDGSQVRTWCYIKDFIAGIDSALTSNYINEIFNIGNPFNKITIYELAVLIKSLIGSKSEIIVSHSSVPDVKFRTVDIKKATDKLNYIPNYSLYEGLANFIEWRKSI